MTPLCLNRLPARHPDFFSCVFDFLDAAQRPTASGHGGHDGATTVPVPHPDAANPRLRAAAAAVRANNAINAGAGGGWKRALVQTSFGNMLILIFFHSGGR